MESREGIALQNQIYQLRQDLKSLPGSGGPRRQRRSAARPAYAPPPQQVGSGDLLAQLLTRVDALEDQVRQLRGRIDETQNQLQRQNDDLNKRIGDLAFQINPQGGQPSAACDSQPSPVPAALGNQPRRRRPAAAPSGPRTPEVALQEGNAALARHDYPAAEAAAREVLANRTSPRAYDAQLLLAQALSGERQYAQAAIAYDDAYNRSRKGNHAPGRAAGARQFADCDQREEGRMRHA